MPNWCWNTLKVSGNAESLKKLVFESQGLPADYPPQEWEKGLERVTPTERFFCFNALVPTPQAVLDMGYDAHGKLPQNIWDLLRQGHPVEKIDGYHWSIQNWGTKWDVYYDHISPEEMGWTEGCESIDFSFTTAWSPPQGWFEKIIQLYPELAFELHYEEPGCFFAGIMYGENGAFSIDEFDDARCSELFQDMFDVEEEEGENDDLALSGS